MSSWWPAGASGPTRTRFYDSAGELTQIFHPDGKSSITFKFSAGVNGLVREIRDENGESSESLIDAFGRLAEVRGFDLGHVVVTKYDYDGADQLRQVTDPNGNPTQYHWDMLGRIKKIVDPDLGTRQFTYDLADNLHTARDALNRTILYNYDNLDRVIAHPISA